MSFELNAILTIASRDMLKFLRDRGRLVGTFVFPFMFVGLLGGTLKFGNGRPEDALFFVFTGIFGMTIFQSSALGLISLLEDRDNDFSQELFIAPISRYSIILGKILGESLVSLAQAVVLVLLAFAIGLRLTWTELMIMLPISIVICFFGGAFGLMIMSVVTSQRAAQQIFPFLLLPQFFLAGIFTPLYELNPVIDLLSRISPMRYAVDACRDALYQGRSDVLYQSPNGPIHAILAQAPVNLAVMAVLFVAFMIAGTTIFVRQERNR